jgi:hypothetical protein
VFDALDAQLKTQLDRLNAIVTGEVPAFNRLVAEQNVPAVIP